MSLNSRILIERLEIFAYHGCFEQEKLLGQRFTLDMTLDVDISLSAQSDRLEDTVDYGAVVGVASKAFTARPFNLLEAAARAVAEAVLAAFPAVAGLAITLRKVSPPIPAALGAVGVSLEFRRHG